MEYSNDTLEGRCQFLIIELLKRTIKKSKNKHYLRPQLDVYNKKIITKSDSSEIKSKQNSLTYTSFEKIKNLGFRFSLRLVNRSTKK